jgi:cytoskeletal protein RodZ
MKRVGQVLKEARLKKGLTLSQIEIETKIRQRILGALEEGQYHLLPAPTYVKGLIKNYGEFLTLPASSLIALYRREVKVNRSKDRHQQNGVTRSFMKNITFTPTLTFATITLTVLTILIIYLAIQYFSLAAAPQIELTSPSDNQIVKSDTISVSGKTDPGATLTINNKEVSIEEGGTFQVEFLLSEGANYIEVVSTSKLGKQKKLARTVEKTKLP